MPSLHDLLHELGYSPTDLSPVMARVVMQWLEVLPTSKVASALQEAMASPEPLHAFRQTVQSILCPVEAVTATQKKKADTRPSVTPSYYLKALAAQDRLEAMSDSEYLDELLRRRQLL